MKLKKVWKMYRKPEDESMVKDSKCVTIRRKKGLSNSRARGNCLWKKQE